MAMEKLKRHKSPGIDQIPAELINAGVERFSVRSINQFNLEQRGIARGVEGVDHCTYL